GELFVFSYKIKYVVILRRRFWGHVLKFGDFDVSEIP
ncbi:MAG: hypothetical protein ACI814_003554, partial [Mariniblastus sp.]